MVKKISYFKNPISSVLNLTILRENKNKLIPLAMKKIRLISCLYLNNAKLGSLYATYVFITFDMSSGFSLAEITIIL